MSSFGQTGQPTSLLWNVLVSKSEVRVEFMQIYFNTYGPQNWSQGGVIKMHTWALRNLITEFGRAARRPHVPRESAMRELYVCAGVDLPEGGGGWDELKS